MARLMVLRTERDASITDFVEVNDAVYKMYCLARQTNKPGTTSTRRSFADC